MKRHLRILGPLLLLFLSGQPKGYAEESCGLRHFGGDSYVCVCNSTFCDELPIITPVRAGIYLAFQSTLNGHRFAVSEGSFTSWEGEKAGKESADEVDVTYTVGPAAGQQLILGFGGALTDAAAINILSLSQANQRSLLSSYFSPSGLEYNMMRIPMAGCDFSTHIYSYDEVEGDFELQHFNLTSEDLNMKIPLIHRIQRMTKTPLKILASPWSAPGWMKTNKAMSGGGKLIGQAGDRYHKSWAQYFVKFVQHYQVHNISIWGLTAQNEPIDGFIPLFPFQSMGFSPTSQRDFISTDLGPALSNAGLRKVKLIIMDDQRFLLPKWADTVLADNATSRYVDGIGVHWYFNYITPASVLSKTRQRHPDKFLLSTEACEGSMPWQTKVVLGDWSRAEAYATDIMENLLNGVGGWIDWNLALDTQGGPNWASNFVDSPIIVNAKADEFYKQPMFYALGHFSKFISAGSYMVQGESVLTPHVMTILTLGLASHPAKSLLICTAERPDKGLALVVLNKSSTTLHLRIVDGRRVRGSFVAQIAPRSISSFIWW
ncbi:hypothetical protein RvY_18985 [Ramazzottius varieornatus]|uniref:Glucosylceramidase n=1 Tax=Ramazzottius varieornatus TaxID=947166 RepID=A0A1D1WBY7_RAMVA|nr:hypothetical protein RvY_18985 [Ramazzottius varieornatus]